MNHRYHILVCLLALMGLMASLSGCTDELEGVVSHSRPSDVISFTTSLSGSRAASMSRGASGHLAIEQEEWLVGVEKKQGASRGTPVSLLEGSAGVIGYVYDTWKEPMTKDEKGTLPWDILYNKQFDFDGDELKAVSADIRWSQIVKMANNNHVLFHAYAPYNLRGATLSNKTTGGAPTMRYRVDDDVTKQHDFIVASWQGSEGTNYGKDSNNKDIEPQTIPLVFEHALTAVKFKVGFACTVTELKIEGIYNNGVYTFGSGWSESTTPTTDSYSFTYGENGAGKSFAANEALTDDDNTLMMIPQTLPTGANVELTYIKNGQEQTITSSLKGKEWEEGKMITYTIHESNAPTTVYFDLAADSVIIGKTATDEDVLKYKESFSDIKKGDVIYVGSVYVGGEPKLVVGKHEPNCQYYVYQSSTSTEKFNKDYTGYANENDYNNKINCRIPDYAPVEYQNQLWSDYITNNNDVNAIINAWYEDNTSETAAKVGRTGTKHRIIVNAVANTTFDLVIDDIYSTFQTQSQKRKNGGISFSPGTTKKCVLKIKTLGDNRLGNIHYYNLPKNIRRSSGITSTLADMSVEDYIETYNNESYGSQIIFEGTGSLTVADVIRTQGGSPSGFYGNFYCSAIGGNDDGTNEECMGIVINSGVLFAGTTVSENSTAIGGGGNGFGEITINGGTVTAVASTTGTAIGGGIGYSSNGGEGRVYIHGGNVYAYNLDNRKGIPSSAIGGAGSNASTGTLGVVEITGGYVYAYSALGTAIGGGSSGTNVGGDAKVTLSGGQVIAKSDKGSGIGGGSACTTGSRHSTDDSVTSHHGGTAIVNISGNPIIRTGSIGGGSSKDLGPDKEPGNDDDGKIGSANITISGGDIQAQFVMAAGAKQIPTFTMNGGLIRNSNVNDGEYPHLSLKGGAVYLEDGTFTMNGGTIKNCSAVQGGAVYVESQTGNSTFTMSGGEIHSCFATGKDATKGHGGAVCLNGGQVLMTGGKIWNNYSVNGDGGAVYISNGNFFMQDGLPEISGNSAQKGNGGGVFVSSAGSEVQVNLLRGLITGNSANNNGGGVCVDMGTTSHAASVIVGEAGAENNTTPDISGNTAMLSGGGLYVRGLKANITIDGGNIKGNQVSAYVKNENVANEGGEVTLNAEHVTDFVTVTFDANGGYKKGASSVTEYEQKIVINTNSKLAENQFEQGGKNFVRWNNRPDNLGDISYDNGAKINISKDITLYAIWTDQ